MSEVELAAVHLAKKMRALGKGTDKRHTIQMKTSSSIVLILLQTDEGDGFLDKEPYQLTELINLARSDPTLEGGDDVLTNGGLLSDQTVQ